MAEAGGTHSDAGDHGDHGDHGRSIAALAALVGASIEVPAGADRRAIETTVVTGLEMIDRAQSGELTFVGNAKFAKLITTTKALAIVASADIELPDEARTRTLLKVKSADHAMMAILERFAPVEALPATGIDPTARIDAGAHVDPTARIGAGATVSRGARVGASTTLFPGVTIYENALVGTNCVLHANVVVRERCVIGNRVILASGVAIGTDGFGYRPSADGRGIAKIPHIGNVVIEDDVEIGANSCVDRGRDPDGRIEVGAEEGNP
ncbi:MAG: LpxD N-terminal domain-containing protein, partial [bacterium]